MENGTWTLLNEHNASNQPRVMGLHTIHGLNTRQLKRLYAITQLQMHYTCDVIAAKAKEDF